LLRHNWSGGPLTELMKVTAELKALTTLVRERIAADREVAQLHAIRDAQMERMGDPSIRLH